MWRMGLGLHVARVRGRRGSKGLSEVEGSEESVKALLDGHRDMGRARLELTFDTWASWKGACAEVGVMSPEQRPKTRKEREKLAGAGRQAGTGSVGGIRQAQAVNGMRDLWCYPKGKRGSQ